MCLYRQFSCKFLLLVLPVIEEEEAKVEQADGTEISIPVNIVNPNPNDVEFDNLYLDMNGIVRAVKMIPHEMLISC